MKISFHRGWAGRRRLPVLGFVVAVVLSGPAQAADYYVFGRVMSANHLPAGQTPPNNLLTNMLALFPAAVVGENAYAVGYRSMVRVTIFDNATNAQLGGDFLVFSQGAGYWLKFTNPAATLSVRFVVRDAVTGLKVMESKPVSIAPGVNMRYLLVPTELVVIGPGSGIKFAPISLGNTFLFTRVGKVEVSEIKPEGFANPSPAAVSALFIPAYQDAPFGGNLFLFGAFSQVYYPLTGEGSYCYKVFRNDTPITDTLEKTRYTVNADGTVTAMRIKVGPLSPPPAGWVVSNCYRLTPIAEAGNVFWSFPDLVALWQTGNLSGRETLTVKLYNATTGVEQPLLTNANSSRVLFVDNTPLVVRFDQIEQQSDTGAKEVDLVAKGCDIAQLSGNRRFFIKYTAHHPTGFLLNYSLTATPNVGPSVAGMPSDAYVPGGPWLPGPPPRPPIKQGTSAAGSTVTKTAADFLESCAYIFTLSAWARTTDGYAYLNWQQLQKAYYILK